MPTQRTAPGIAGTQREEQTGLPVQAQARANPLDRYEPVPLRPTAKTAHRRYFETGPPQWNPYKGALANLWDIARDPVYFTSGEEQNAAEKAVSTVWDSFLRAASVGYIGSENLQITEEDQGFLQSTAQALGTMAGFGLMLAGPSKMLAALKVPKHLAPLVTGAVYGTAQPAEGVAERFNNMVHTTSMFGAFHFGAAGLGKVLPKKFVVGAPRAAGFVQAGVPFGAFEAGAGALEGLPIEELIPRTLGATLGGGMFGLGTYKGGAGAEARPEAAPRTATALGELPAGPDVKAIGPGMQGLASGKRLALPAEGTQEYVRDFPQDSLKDPRRPAEVAGRVAPVHEAEAGPAEHRATALKHLQNVTEGERVRIKADPLLDPKADFPPLGELVRMAQRAHFRDLLKRGFTQERAAVIANESLVPEADRALVEEGPHGEGGVRFKYGVAEEAERKVRTEERLRREEDERTGKGAALTYERGRYKVEPEVERHDPARRVPGPPDRPLTEAELAAYDRIEGKGPLFPDVAQERDVQAAKDIELERAGSKELLEDVAGREELSETAERLDDRTAAARDLDDGRTFNIFPDEVAGYKVDANQTDADGITFIGPDGDRIIIEDYSIGGPVNDRTVAGFRRTDILTYKTKKGVVKTVKTGEMTRERMKKLGVRSTPEFTETYAEQVAPTKAKGRVAYLKQGDKVARVTTTRTPEEHETFIAKVNKERPAGEKRTQLLPRAPKEAAPKVPRAEPPQTRQEIEQELLDATTSKDGQRREYAKRKKQHTKELGEEKAHEVARHTVFQEEADAIRAEQLANHDLFREEQSRLEAQQEDLDLDIKESRAKEKEAEAFRAQEAADRETDPEGRKAAVAEKTRSTKYKKQVNEGLKSTKKALEQHKGDVATQREIVDKAVEQLGKDTRLNTGDILEMTAELYEGVEKLKEAPKTETLADAPRTTQKVDVATEQDALTESLALAGQGEGAPLIGEAITLPPSEVARAQIIEAPTRETIDAELAKVGRAPKQQVDNAVRGEVWYDPATGNRHLLVFPTRKNYRGEWVPHPTRYESATKADKRGTWLTVRIREDGTLDRSYVTDRRLDIRGVEPVEIKDMKNWYNLGRQGEGMEGVMSESAQEMYGKALTRQREKPTVVSLDSTGQQRPTPKEWGKSEKARKAALERDTALVGIQEGIDYGERGAVRGDFATAAAPREPGRVFPRTPEAERGEAVRTIGEEFTPEQIIEEAPELAAKRETDTWYDKEAQKKREAQRVARELDMPEPLRDDLDLVPTDVAERRELGKQLSPDTKLLASELMNEVVDVYRRRGDTLSSQEAEDIVLDALLEGRIPKELEHVFKQRC